MILNIIKTRRAVYPAQYNGEKITKHELQTILEAANWAPTHRRTEPWRFRVFHSESSRNELSIFLGETYRDTIEKFSEAKWKKIMLKPKQAGCVLAICMQRDPKESVPEWEEIAATAMAVQNMWLAAREVNIGAYWSTPDLKNYMHRHIDLAAGEKCLGFFYMGKYDGELPAGTRQTSIEEKSTWY